MDQSGERLINSSFDPGVDKRADIWAFGVVLYEMLTGRQSFAAGIIPETIAAVLTKEPDWKKMQDSI